MAKEFSMTPKEMEETCNMMGVDIFKFEYLSYKHFIRKLKTETEEEECDDIFIYKTLRYPPNSKSPTPN